MARLILIMVLLPVFGLSQTGIFSAWKLSGKSTFGVKMSGVTFKELESINCPLPESPLCMRFEKKGTTFCFLIEAIPHIKSAKQNSVLTKPATAAGMGAVKSFRRIQISTHIAKEEIYIFDAELASGHQYYRSVCYTMDCYNTILMFTYVISSEESQKTKGIFDNILPYIRVAIGQTIILNDVD